MWKRRGGRETAERGTVQRGEESLWRRVEETTAESSWENKEEEKVWGGDRGFFRGEEEIRTECAVSCAAALVWAAHLAALPLWSMCSAHDDSLCLSPLSCCVCVYWRRTLPTECGRVDACRSFCIIVCACVCSPGGLFTVYEDDLGSPGPRLCQTSSLKDSGSQELTHSSQIYSETAEDFLHFIRHVAGGRPISFLSFKCL